MSEISNTPTTLFAKEVKIRTLEYKLTVFLIALALFVLWPFMSNIWGDYTSLKDQSAAAVQEATQKEQQRAQIVQDISMLQQVSSDTQKIAITQCYNTRCQNLPESLRNEPQKSIFKSYLQLQQPNDTKFIIDQKKILSYLNEFLIKSSDGNGINWQIQAISFAGSEPVPTTNLIRIPMSVTMSFPNKQWLLWFLRNIEQLISPTFPMLGIVQSVTYDIVKTDVSQDVVVIIDIYMLDQ